MTTTNETNTSTNKQHIWDSSYELAWHGSDTLSSNDCLIKTPMWQTSSGIGFRIYNIFSVKFQSESEGTWSLKTEKKLGS